MIDSATPLSSLGIATGRSAHGQVGAEPIVTVYGDVIGMTPTMSGAIEFRPVQAVWAPSSREIRGMEFCRVGFRG